MLSHSYSGGQLLGGPCGSKGIAESAIAETSAEVHRSTSGNGCTVALATFGTGAQEGSGKAIVGGVGGAGGITDADAATGEGSGMSACECTGANSGG